MAYQAWFALTKETTMGVGSSPRLGRRLESDRLITVREDDLETKTELWRTISRLNRAKYKSSKQYVRHEKRKHLTTSHYICLRQQNDLGKR